MTFKDFEKLVKEKYPKAELTPHGKFAGSKINVSIAFNGTHEEKVYQYNGTYCQVLNRLGIKAIYKTNYDSRVELELPRLKEEHGQKDQFFGFVIDNLERIQEIENLIEEVKSGKCIVV